MKSQVSGVKARREAPFPKLMVGKVTNVVILFESPEDGVVVHLGEHLGIALGERYHNCSVEMFKDFFGTVSLSNDDFC